MFKECDTTCNSPLIYTKIAHQSGSSSDQSHLTLAHASIDSGVPFGFIVDQSNRLKADGIRMNREISSDTITQLWVYFDVILADHLFNPDGSFHTNTRTQMYSKLLLSAELPSTYLITPADKITYFSGGESIRTIEAV